MTKMQADTKKLIDKLVQGHFKDVKKALLKEEIRRGDKETQYQEDLERSSRGYY